MAAARQQSQRTEKADFGKLTWTVTFFIILILRKKNVIFLNFSTAGNKEENKGAGGPE